MQDGKLFGLAGDSFSHDVVIDGVSQRVDVVVTPKSLPRRYQPYLLELARQLGIKGTDDQQTRMAAEDAVWRDILLHETYDSARFLGDHLLAFHAQSRFHYAGRATPFQLLQLIMLRYDPERADRVAAEDRSDHEADIHEGFSKDEPARELTQAILDRERAQYGGVKFVNKAVVVVHGAPMKLRFNPQMEARFKSARQVVLRTSKMGYPLDLAITLGLK